MVHITILRKFKDIGIVEENDIECWFPNGKGSIRVRTKSYGDLIFTYTAKKKWKLESVDSWLDSVKQEVE